MTDIPFQLPVNGTQITNLAQNLGSQFTQSNFSSSLLSSSGLPGSLLGNLGLGTGAGAGTNTDARVRLAALNPSDVYASSPIMALLNDTNGMLFPYTPSVTFTQSVDYLTLQLVHSNTDYQAYTRTPSVKISISGKFTVQNQREGLYALACVHFLRTVSKSHFGETDSQAGLPPPVLALSGYGNYMFNNLRVILTSHSWTFDETMDMVSISVQGGIVKLPPLFTISCEVVVIQTPTRMRKTFNFTDFANGTLMSGSNNGWI